VEQDTDEDKGERRRRKGERESERERERRVWRVGKGKARGAVRYSGCSYEVASSLVAPTRVSITV
jgi:hypothetical protein